jgi:hypothetical protein
MTQAACPSFLTHFQRLQSDTNDPLKAESGTHVASDCPNCVRRERLARSVLKALGHDPLPEAPLPWRARAVRLAAADQPGLLSRAQGFLARLVRDAGGDQELVPALRGEGPAERHLLFEAGPFEVDLALIDSGALVGQVHAAGRDRQELEDGVCVLYSEDDTREALLDSDGDFHFASVRPGAYDLVLETPSVRLLLPDVDLGTYGESA